MDLGITDRIALVTGGDSGIGLATARELLAEGARVVLTDQKAEGLEAAVAELGAGPDRLLPVLADLTVPAEVDALVAQARDAFGDPEILVHAAGVTGAQGLFHEIDDEGWASTIEIDLLATVRVVRAVLGPMRAAGRGRIVLLASEDGVQPYVDELPYCAAKAGVLSLAKGLSKSYGPEGVLVNAVSPAFVATPMTDAMMDKRADERGTDRDEAIRSFLDEERPLMALKRRGEPDEVAAVIAFLVSERASFVNGSNYRVDAGSVATI
ncbi:SDR family NAD(P)-dependent oxidoreductase [Cellulomonas triticagri]|uniref:SDR family oxidoreductase n=1 Tax=Cellulomonas triticagri TaxID=2483352 RepID=A0A3M2IWD6_9CELL|nr:SDR family oxidoreductase [Cellulomonas triticagri]RMI04754.1 SDR family oxidoreductase [Cellulomonas triticagri]